MNQNCHLLRCVSRGALATVLAMAALPVVLITGYMVLVLARATLGGTIAATAVVLMVAFTVAFQAGAERGDAEGVLGGN